MTATRVLILGTMRSGTTMMCDLLTKPGQSLVLAEPMLGTPWRGTDGRETRLTNIVKRFGFPKETMDGIGDAKVPPLVWFRDTLRPHLETLKLWGIKEVLLEQAPRLIEEIEPEKLIICIRDLRDVYLSALDLICKVMLIFPGGGLRDEAWALERLRADVSFLEQLTKRDHVVVRYESFVESAKEQETLRSQLGIEAFGGGGATLREAGVRRDWEVDKHQGVVTNRSVKRNASEKDGFALAIANAVAAEQTAFLAKHGYDAPASKLAGIVRPRPGDWRIVNKGDWPGQPGDLAYARRRARKMLAANIKEGARLVDIGSTVPAMPLLLNGKAHVMCVDPSREGPLQYRRNWSTDGLPAVAAFTDASLLAVLEWYDRKSIRGLMIGLRKAGLTVWIAYHCLEDRPDAWESAGMRSDLSRRDWQELATSLKFRLTPVWAFDQHQSFLRLRPN